MASVYVVGKFEEAKLVKAVIDLLEQEGHRVTHDWTDESVEGLRGTEVTDVLQCAAIEDIQGVKNADAVITLHHDKLKGGNFEMGAALALDKPVIVVGGHQGLDQPIFYWHPDVFHVPHIDGALAMLKTLFPPETDELTFSEPTEDEIEEGVAFADCGCPECVEPETEEPEPCPCILCTPDAAVIFNPFKIGVA